MAVNYRFALDLDLRPMRIKTVGTNPQSVVQFQTTDGALWIATADFFSNQVSLFQIAGVDGIVDDQATITSNTRITKTVGTNPYSVFQFQATDGTRWIATADSSSSRVSLFQIAGVDGIVDDQATITSNTLITKTVGNSPRSVFQFQGTDGTRWIATADSSSARVSLFQIAGVDGIVDDQATITANTLITKTVGATPFSVVQFQATNGTRWIATADFSSNRVSLFQIAGVDGIVQSQATITSNTLITKTVGTNPFSVVQFQATNGTRWIATADFTSSRVSLFQIAGTDGIVQSQATITANTLITKPVGTNPYSVVQLQGTDGTRWIATADNGSNRVSLFQIAGTDGIVQSQATITANTLITKNVGNGPQSIFQFQATDGILWIATADVSSARVSLFQITDVAGAQLLPNNLNNVAVSLSIRLITAANLAELTSSLDYFNFSAGVSPVAFTLAFNYTFDFDDSGTIGSGSALRLTTATADITNSSGITVASGATVRLGKKATYTIDFFFQNGSTLEVFPNADRSGANLDLRNCTFAATTTINVTSGTATVLVPLGSAANITAGAGVTIQEPVVAYTAASLVNGTRLYLAHQQSFLVASSAINTGPDTITLGNDSNSQPPAFATGSPYTNAKIQATAGATLPTTSPQIVDGGRYYATISSGAITLFVKESDIAGTPITISTAGTNASGSIFTLIAETQLTNTTISGGSGASVALTLANGDRVVRKAIYWASSAGVATATPLYIQEFLWSTTAGINDPVVVNPAIELNEVHEDIVASTSVQIGGRIKNASGTVVTELTAANDGSTLDASNSGPYSFGLEGGGGRVQVNASDADGLSLWQDIYIWGVWVSSTAPGIRLINADTSVAITANNFVFANFEIDNTSSTRLNIVGGNATSADGSSLVAPGEPGTGGINPNALSLGTLLTFESGTSGLTAGEAEDLADLAATLQTAGVFSTAALVNAPSGGGLTAQQVRDALKLAPTAGSPSAGSVDADLDTLVARNNPLDAAGTRSAVGLGSANLDTQLGAIDTVVDAILVDTDATIPAQITARTLAAADYFDPATDTVANVTTVGTVTNKTGYSLSDGAITPAKIQDGAFTSAKFAAGAFDAVWTAATRTLTAIADSSGVTTLLSRIGSALTITSGAVTVGTNNDKTGYSLTTPPLDSTATQAAAAAALTAYDPPTRAELTSDVGTVTTAIAGLNNLSTAQVNAEVDTALADVGLTPTVTGRIDAAISSRLATAGYTAPANGDIALIKAKTDTLPSDPADQSAVEAAITAATSGLSTLTAAQVWVYSGGDRTLSGAQATAITSAATLAQVQAAGFTTDRHNALIAAEAAARAVASGRHKINYAASTATQYNADGSVRTVFDLVDADGDPATTGATAVERVPR
jgi:hypothetical protein